MSERMLAEAEQWIALALALGVIAAALGAATARSLFAVCLYLAAAGAMAATALLAMHQPNAALGEALFALGIAPFVMLAALLLSTRAVKPSRRGRPWLTLAAALAAGGAVLWALPDLAVTPARIAMGPEAAPQLAIVALLAPLLFVGAATCVALLGFGERGALEHPLPLEREL
jgi:hypothetical protein